MDKKEKLTPSAKSRILDSIAEVLTEMFLKANVGFSYNEVFARYRYRLTKESTRNDIVRWLKIKQKKTGNPAEKSMIENILDWIVIVYGK